MVFQDLHLQPQYLFYVIIAAATASLLGSLWTLHAVSHGPPKLLKKQLFHQALGTTLFNCVFLMVVFLEETMCGAHVFQSAKRATVIAHGVWFVSCLVELHIAASVAAAACRAPRLLSRLGWWLPSIWPLAILYGAIGIITLEIDAHNEDVLHNDPVGAWIVVVCFVSTFLLYLVALHASKSAHAPDVVLTRMRRRAMVYPAVFVATGIPTCGRYLQIFELCSDLGMLSLFMEMSEGFLNALIFRTMRGVPGAHVSTEMTTEVELRVVGFDVDVEEVEAVAGTSWRQALQWSQPAGTQGSASLDEELDIANEQTRSEEEETARMWHAYVGDDAYG